MGFIKRVDMRTSSGNRTFRWMDEGDFLPAAHPVRHQPLTRRFRFEVGRNKNKMQVTVDGLLEVRDGEWHWSLYSTKYSNGSGRAISLHGSVPTRDAAKHAFLAELNQMEADEIARARRKALAGLEW